MQPKTRSCLWQQLLFLLLLVGLFSPQTALGTEEFTVSHQLGKKEARTIVTSKSDVREPGGDESRVSSDAQVAGKGERQPRAASRSACKLS